VNSFTCEASFAGPTYGSHANCHFNTDMLESIGKSFCKTMFDITDSRDRVKKVLQDLQIRYPVNAKKNDD